MFIKNLHINNFGKLQNKDIEFGNEVNLIVGQNESGKSSLLKFIIGMFYGLNRNKNGKRISDIERFTPWNEGEFSGKITYILDNGQEFEVYRNFTKKNPQILDNSGNDVSKKYTIDKTYGNRFFVEQTGVDEELFNMAMTVEQQEVKLDDKRQNSLIQKASNIMLTGEDDVSYREILGKLTKRQSDEIGTDRSPTKPLFLLKKKAQELENQKNETKKLLPLQYMIDEEKSGNEEEIKKSEIELELMQEIQKMQIDTKAQEETININIKSKENIENTKKEEEEKLRATKEKRATKKELGKLYILPILLLTLAIILFVLGQNIIAFGALAFCIISLGVSFVINMQESKRYEKAKDEERQEISSINNKIELLENEIKEKDRIILEKKNEIQIKRDIKMQELKNRFSIVYDIDRLFREEVTSGNIIEEQRHINDLKLKNASLDMQKKEVITKIESLAKIEEELSDTEEKLSELISYNEEIELAKESLEKAYMQMKENITPKFTLNLSNAIQNISNGKYKTVKVNDELGLMIETQNGSYVPADILSIGTIDQLYLSLRISSINELTRENMPIILDETFAFFDESRLENVLGFLNREYKEKQILIFSCTDRERKCLDRMGLEYKLLEL